MAKELWKNPETRELHKQKAIKQWQNIGFRKKITELTRIRNIERIKENFGHMLAALASGCPPHGGIAWGLDRLITLLRNEPNIREVIAFPKTGEGRDLMMDAPSEIEEKQLKELGLKIGK